jgi:imidazolonepropionase-like amidohydrolase
VLAATSCSGSRPGAATQLQAGDVWIQDVTLISPERSAPLAHAHVVVRVGRIASVGVDAPGAASPGVTVVHGAGKYLVPGLIDGHVHLAGVPGMSPEQEAAMPEAVAEYDRQLPRSYLYFGFTAIVELNVIDRPRLDRLRAADPGPAIFDCGNSLPLAHGYPMVYMPAAMRFDAYPNFLYDPAQKATIPKKFVPTDHSPEAAVGRVAAGGGRCVKAFYEPGFDPRVGKLPVPTVSLMNDVREASHRRKLPLLLHANSVDAHRFAAAVKPDAVVHGMWNWGQEAAGAEVPVQVREVLDAERQAGVAMMPTSRVIGGLADLFVPGFLDDPHLPHVLPARIIVWYRTKDGQSFAREVTQAMVGRSREGRREVLVNTQARGQRAAVYFARKGGRILFGSDTPSAPTYANPPGYNGYLELRELESAGISPKQLLSAATAENARFFGLADYGTIEPGKIASLLILRSDPLVSTAAFDAIEIVIVKGRVLRREALSAAARPQRVGHNILAP